MRDLLKALEGRSFEFPALWGELERIIATNIRDLPVEFGPRELFLLARKRGLLTEDKNGRLHVHSSRPATRRSAARPPRQRAASRMA